MTDYDNLPQASALRQENELVDNAIKMIDAGGSMASFVITPPPPDPSGSPGMPMMMASSVSTMGSPPSPDTMLSIRLWLVQRSADITAELEALGVTDTPAPPDVEPPASLIAKLKEQADAD